MLREEIHHNIGSSFSHIVYDHFTMPWHYHREYELIVITSGGGKRFVGDFVDDFAVGDLVLFGSELPHFHMCCGLIENDSSKISGCEVIQFPRSVFPADMDNIQEFTVISELLQRSRRGVKFTNPPSLERICRMMRHLDSLQGVKRVATLFRILEVLGCSSDYQLLTKGNYSMNIVGSNDDDPVNRVYKYLHENFREQIVLEDIASKLGFNTSALCRHYKRRVQKSIFESLQEIRIGFACKLLKNSSLSITQIAFECGYKNIANFNRQFRAIMKLTPSQYKLMYLKRLVKVR